MCAVIAVNEDLSSQVASKLCAVNGMFGKTEMERLEALGFDWPNVMRPDAFRRPQEATRSGDAATDRKGQTKVRFAGGQSFKGLARAGGGGL